MFVLCLKVVKKGDSCPLVLDHGGDNNTPFTQRNRVKWNSFQLSSLQRFVQLVVLAIVVYHSLLSALIHCRNNPRVYYSQTDNNEDGKYRI